MQELLSKLGETLLAGNNELISKLTQDALENGISVEQILESGFMPAMEDLGDRFSTGEAYLPELLLAADTMKVAMEALKPVVVNANLKHKASILIGTVKGDIHNVGLGIVKMMFEGAGFQVIDLGVDTPAEDFLDAYIMERPDLIGLSALLSTTMGEMKDVIELVRQDFPRARFLVGGAPITQKFADSIGADGFAPDAPTGVKIVHRILDLA
jgi:methanogenic corrinoid protein MtbC1